MFIGLEGAAFQSRLPFNKLSPKEELNFPDTATGTKQSQLTFLYVRNRIVSLL